MKRFLITLFILLALPFTVSWSDVDLAVQGVEYWKDGKITDDWTKEDFKDFWQQTHKGEIIGAFEVGTSFGTNVSPPKIIRITITGVTLEQANQYLEPLMEDDTIMTKQKRFHFPRAFIDLVINDFDGHIIMAKFQAVNTIKEYDIAAIKQKIKDRLKR